jgi:glycosyltransferase involved in cell wall biosynthesis
MMDTTKLRIANLYDYDPGSAWLDALRADLPPVEFDMYSAVPGPWLRRLPGPNWGRVRAALALRSAVRAGRVDLVASQMPFNTHYAARFSLGAKRDIPHIGFGFNFTDLPSGYRLRAMRRSLPSVDRFCVFTEVERAIYADLFELPIERFRFNRWTSAPPIGAPSPRTIAEPYFVAIGGEARDYATLAETARLLPARRFVVVARPNSFDGISVPDNLTLLVNRPWQETWSLAAHASAMLVPLRNNRTPNGIVTIVGAMYMGIPLIVTDSAGVHDYLQDDQTALLTPAQDAPAFVRAIERMSDEPSLRDRLSRAAQAFAQAHCSTQAAADFAAVQIRDVLKSRS